MEKILRNDETESGEEVEGVERVSTPNDHQMSEEEANLFREQIQKQVFQDEKHTLHEEADALEALPDGIYAASFLRQAELACQNGEILAKVKEYLLSLPEEERQEALALAQKEGFPLHLLVSDDALKGDTVVEGPRTLQ